MAISITQLEGKRNVDQIRWDVRPLYQTVDVSAYQSRKNALVSQSPPTISVRARSEDELQALVDAEVQSVSKYARELLKEGVTRIPYKKKIIGREFNKRARTAHAVTEYLTISMDDELTTDFKRAYWLLTHARYGLLVEEVLDEDALDTMPEPKSKTPPKPSKSKSKKSKKKK